MMSLMLCSCGKGNKSDVPETQVNRYTPGSQQTVSPADMASQQQMTDTTAAESSPDMFEQEPFEYYPTNKNNQNTGLGAFDFDDLPGLSDKKETTSSSDKSSTSASSTAESSISESSTVESSTSSTEASRQGSLTGSVLAGTVAETAEQLEMTTEEETTTYAMTAEETKESETEESKVSDLVPVSDEDTTYVMKQQIGAYSKNVDVQYTERGNVAYKRDIVIPDVIGFDKDAYENYIINPELFKNGQTKLPKFSYYGYKIPYLYWYDIRGKLLNPLPIEYSLYRNMFYFADDAVIDPYAVTSKEEKESSISETTVAYETRAADKFEIKTDDKTEADFLKHAEEVGSRYRANLKELDYEERKKTDINVKMDEAEIEYATSIGFGGYYENKIGPGFQGDISGAGNTFMFFNPEDNKQYELSLLQMKELLGSGEWRKLNEKKFR